jgi:hypothetical protein
MMARALGAAISRKSTRQERFPYFQEHRKRVPRSLRDSAIESSHGLPVPTREPWLSEWPKKVEELSKLLQANQVEVIIKIFKYLDNNGHPLTGKEIAEKNKEQNYNN